MKSNRNPMWWPVATVSLVLFLSACSSNPPVSSTDTPPEDEKDHALVFGDVESDIYEELKGEFEMVPYDGSQEAGDFPLVILDGHDLTPEQIREEEIIVNSLHAGVWVLSLDVGAEHKKDGLGHHLGAATDELSPGYLTYVHRDTTGVERVWIVEASLELLASEESGADGQSRKYPDGRALSRAGAARFAERVVRYVKEPELSVQQTPTDDIPAGLSHKIYYFPSTTSYTSKPGIKGAAQKRTQTGEVETNYAVYVLLNNQDNPQGDFQYVLVETEGSGNPTRGEKNFVNWEQDERGWFQVRFDTQMTPDQYLTLQPDSQPENANGVTSVTSNIGFEVGYSAGGVGTFNYSNSQTRDITDWLAQNNSSVATGTTSWTFAAQNPNNGLAFYNPRTSVYDPVDSGGFDTFDYWPKTPNNLSQNTMQFFTQSLWKTGSVVDDWVHFSTANKVQIRDNYCINDLWLVCSVVGETDDAASFSTVDDTRTVASPTLAINLGTVIPATLKSLTFDPNPVKAGQSTTATLTLAAPAQTAITFSVSSGNPAVVPAQDEYTIPSGQSQVSFQLDTGTSSAGSAGIGINYGAGINAVLNISP